MEMSIFSQFQLRRLTEEPVPAQRALGVATLFAALAAAGEGAPLSIMQDGDDATPFPVQAGASRDADDWSVWAYAHRQWSFIVIGASSLDDVATDIVLRMADSDCRSQEIRICPPGTMQPRGLS